MIQICKKEEKNVSETITISLQSESPSRTSLKYIINYNIPSTPVKSIRLLFSVYYIGTSDIEFKLL